MIVLAYLACAIIWGTTWFAIRVCIAPDGYPTYMAAALRFTMAGLILGGIAAAGLPRPGLRGAKEWRWVIGAGVLNAIGYGLIYAAEERITGGLSAVLYGTLPIITAVITSATGVERPTTGSVAGALVSLGGIATIYMDRVDVSAAQATGVLLVLGSVALSAVYNIILKQHATRQHPMATNAVFLSTSAVALWLFTLTVERAPLPATFAWKPTVALVYLGVIGSVLAFACYFYLIKRVRLMTLSTLVFIQPIIALSADALWDAEARRVTMWMWAGIGLTLCGVCVTVLSRAPAHGKR